MNANMNEYRSLMENVNLPVYVHDAVASEARRIRSGTAMRPIAPRRVRPVLGVATAAACALALAAGIGIAGSILGLNGAPASTDAPALVEPQTGNFFALAAYAAENPEEEPGKAVAVSLGRFSPGSSAGTINLLTGEEYIDNRRVYAFVFDVTCTGENIQSITYEIIGNDVYFEWYDEEEFLRAHGVYGNDDPAVENGYSVNSENTFTVEYDNQDLRESRINCRLLVPFSMQEKAQTLLKQLVRSEGDEFMSILPSALAAEAADASQALSQSQLNVTATFADGSTQSKSYAIAPIDGFEEAYRAYLDAENTLQKKQGTTEGLEEPKLYTITEMVEK